MDIYIYLVTDYFDKLLKVPFVPRKGDTIRYCSEWFMVKHVELDLDSKPSRAVVKAMKI